MRPGLAMPCRPGAGSLRKGNKAMMESSGFFKPVTDFFSRTFHNDVAIDLGTMNTLCYVRGRGVVLDEPTVITVNPQTHEVIAVGSEAKSMLGVSTGNILAVRPMRQGAMSDTTVTAALIAQFLRKVQSPFCPMRPRVMVAVPSGISQLVRQAVHDTVKSAGARVVRLVEEPLAAAIGAGLPVDSPEGCMIVDIGGGTTEIAVVALGNIVHCNSVNYAGDAMDKAIVDHMKDVHSLSIGELVSEQVKITLGSAVPFKQLNKDELTMEVRGTMLKPHGNNLPSCVVVNSEEIRSALVAPIGGIVNAIAKTLAVCRPSLAGNLSVYGMTITGGSSQLPGLDVLLRDMFKIPVHRAANPTKSVILGMGKMLERANIFDSPQAPPVGPNV